MTIEEKLEQKKVHVIKRLPWYCTCGKPIYTITWKPERECFEFTCVDCYETYST